jgi:hypothetical protein
MLPKESLDLSEDKPGYCHNWHWLIKHPVEFSKNNRTPFCVPLPRPALRGTRSTLLGLRGLSTGFSRLTPICPSNPAAPSARLGRDLGSVGFRQDGRCESVLPDPLASPVSLPARKTLPAGSQRSKSGVTLSRFPSSDPLTVHTRTHPPGMRQARGRRAPPQPRGRSHGHGDAGADHNDEKAGRTTRHAGTTKKGEETGWTTDRKGRRRGHGDTQARPLRRRRASSVTEDEGTGRERDSPGRRPRSEGCGVLTLTFHDVTSTRTWPGCAPATGQRDRLFGCRRPRTASSRSGRGHPQAVADNYSAWSTP